MRVWHRGERRPRQLRLGSMNPEDEWRFEVRGGTGGPENLSAEEKRGHPASRRGSGTTVMWRNEPHCVSAWMRCFCCGWYQDEFTRGTAPAVRTTG